MHPDSALVGKERASRTKRKGRGCPRCPRACPRSVQRASHSDGPERRGGTGSTEVASQVPSVFLMRPVPAGPWTPSHMGLVSSANSPETTQRAAGCQPQPCPATWPWATPFAPLNPRFLIPHAENAIKLVEHLAPRSHSTNVSSPSPPYSS